jgi:predicted transcriptional regulator
MELAEKLKLSQNQARRILRDGFQAGLLEKFKGTKNEGGRAYCKVWYRKKNQT